MKNRFLILGTTMLAFYIPASGCGDDDEATPPPAGNPDATSDSTTGDGPGGDTSVVDTGIADVLPDRSAEQTGSACTAPTQCYGALDAASLKGAPRCLDKVTDGYCTHVCNTDDDCCAVPGECRTTFKQICATFENANEKYCFLSCEAADIADAGVDAGGNATSYCTGQLSSEFTCRATGGGDPRKACLPVGPTVDAGPDTGTDAADASDALDAADADG